MNDITPATFSQQLHEKFDSQPVYSIYYITYLGIIFLMIVKTLTEVCYGVIKNGIYSASLIELHKVTYYDDTPRIFELLTSKPYLINIPIGKDGYTPFLRSCLNGNTEVVRTMLQLGANIYACTARNENAFYLAVYNRIKNFTSNDATCIHALFYAGVNIDEPNWKGINALQLAAMFGHTKLIHWLINKDASIDVKPNPYLLALNCGCWDAARFLKPYYT